MDEQPQGGLLNWFSSPAGQGLLSAVAGYAAGARRGTPVNNLGKGLLSGVTGYSNALEEQKKTNRQKAIQQFFGVGAMPQQAGNATQIGAQAGATGKMPSGLAG